jgi:hypothetical protein
MADRQVMILYAASMTHDCQKEIIQALAPVLENLGPGSLVECSCGVRFIRSGDSKTGLYWEEKEN